MSSWKNWRQKKSLKPAIREHAKDIPKWRVGASILYERFLKYPTYRLAIWAGFGLVGIFLTSIEGSRVMQRRWQSNQYVQLGLEKFKEQKKLISLVGEPLKVGWIYPSYKDSVKKDFVDVMIPIEGSQTDGVINLEASKEGDTWTLNKLTFEFVDEAGGEVQILKRKESS